MPTSLRTILAWFLVLSPGLARAEPSIEELPPPAERSVLVKEPPAARDDQPDPSASASPSSGWGLIGPSARHYFVGKLALTDYWFDGQRQVVALTEEDPTSHAAADPHFLYYREEPTGHRWAIARQPGLDGGYRIYFQAASAAGTWRLIQRARLTWDERPVAEVYEPAMWVELTCGN